jgi:hypothetical protein
MKLKHNYLIKGCLGLLFSLACLINTANAGLIIDTGSNAQGPSWSWGSFQNFSGRFTTIQDWNINSIEAFVSNDGVIGDIDVAIWSSAANSPLAVLFGATGTIAGGAQANWYGVSGLNEFLSAGTYWVSVTPGTGVNGIHYGGAPNPLDGYNQRSTGNPWQLSDDSPGEHLAIGFRIDATAASVPEPSTLAIFALGMIGLASRRFKKQ